jgi:hypothetical protein
MDIENELRNIREKYFKKEKNLKAYKKEFLNMQKVEKNAILFRIEKYKEFHLSLVKRAKLLLKRKYKIILEKRNKNLSKQRKFYLQRKRYYTKYNKNRKNKILHENLYFQLKMEKDKKFKNGKRNIQISIDNANKLAIEVEQILNKTFRRSERVRKLKVKNI